MHYSSILPEIINIADEASAEVLRIYQSDFFVSYKEDESPITAADVASHNVIVNGLRKISPEIPILSEEGTQAPWEERKRWQRFWLIDPIDGTKEFTQRTGEFTVNIALIENGEPVMGVVTAPALNEVFWGINGEGAYKRDHAGQVCRIYVAEPGDIKRVVASKSHLNEATRAFINSLGAHTTLQAGSSLKFCRIAEGQADIYPRMGPTCEWDTAAAHAVLLAAGGDVHSVSGGRLQYGKEDVLNSHFVAAGSGYFNDASG